MLRATRLCLLVLFYKALKTNNLKALLTKLKITNIQQHTKLKQTIDYNIFAITYNNFTFISLNK